MPHRHLLKKSPRQAIEPTFIPDTFCDKLHSTELISPELFRFVFTVEQRCLFTGVVENVVVAKLIVPKDAALQNTRDASRDMGVKSADSFGG